MVTLVSPQQIARTQNLAQMLAGQASQGGPIRSPLQGIGNIAQAIASNTLANRADRQQKQRADAAQQALLALVGGGAFPVGTPPIVPPAGGAGGSTPNLEALLSTATRFPELGGVLNPMISRALTPPEATKGVVVGAGGRLVNPVTGDLIAEGGPRAPGRPIQVADPTSPTGTKFVTAEEAVGMAGPPGQEIRFETVTGPDGQQRTIMVQGRPRAGSGTGEGSGLTKPTTSKLEQGIVQAGERLARVRNIRESFDPAFLNLPNQLFTKGAAMAERFGVELGPETKQQVAEFTEFRTNTLQNLNRTLNELSGAAVSPAEAQRLKAELPTETDSPTEFMAKTENIERQLQAAIARNQQLLEGGVTNLRFGSNGEILNAPSLEEFMLRQESTPRNVSRETTAAGMATPMTAPAGNFSQMSAQDMLNVDLQSLSPEQREAWAARMDQLGM